LRANSLGGFGGQDTADAAFFEWRFDWLGGTALDVIYFDQSDQSHREHVAL
jgi:hypothetical protein